MSLTPSLTPYTKMEKTLSLKSRSAERKMEELPAEVIQEILSRLPINSLFQSRCVCSTWHNLVNESFFANMHFSQSSRNQISGLILQSSVSEFYTIPDFETCDVAIKRSNLPFKSWLPQFKIMGSCNGFLCLADQYYNYRSIFICNPLTGECMKLPDNATFGKINGFLFGFGFDPKKKEYKVVRMRFLGNDEKSEIEIHTLGTDSWRSIGSIPESDCVGSSVFVNGNLHWLHFDSSFEVDYIIAINVGDEKVRLIQPPPSVVGKDDSSFITLGSLGGCLSLVDGTSMDIAEVWIMKDYDMGKSWNKEFVIEGHNGEELQTLGIQKDGKILMHLHFTGLFSYDPQSKRFKGLGIYGIPTIIDVFPHVASFLSMKDAFAPERWR